MSKKRRNRNYVTLNEVNYFLDSDDLEILHMPHFMRLQMVLGDYDSGLGVKQWLLDSLDHFGRMSYYAHVMGHLADQAYKAAERGDTETQQSSWREYDRFRILWEEGMGWARDWARKDVPGHPGHPGHEEEEEANITKEETAIES